MPDFKLIPLESHGVLKNWKFLQEGIDRVGKTTIGDFSEAMLLNLIAKGELLLWMGFLDGNYCGFLTTRYDVSNFSDNFLTVVHAYIKAGTDPMVFWGGFDAVKEHGRKLKCSKLRFYTTRDKAFEKRMAPIGWKVGYVEFTYDLGGA